MLLQSLRVSDYRNLLDIDLQLSSTLNAFEGHNGAGKTSILEAVDVLVRGRSFRTSTSSNLIQSGKQQLSIESSVIDDLGLRRCFSIQKTKNTTVRWLDGEKVTRQSELSKHLPVVLIHPNVSELVAGTPSQRRTFLDWGLFHVEPGFADCYRRYNRILLQRNAALKQRTTAIAYATVKSLAEIGLEYHQLRVTYMEELHAACLQYFNDFGFKGDIKFQYCSGWPKESSLEDKLYEECSGEKIPKFTAYGPHRADLTLKVNDGIDATECSRGQQKMLALSLKLAQANHLHTQYNKISVLLIDELPAELDRQYLEKVLEKIQELGSQVLITCVSRDQISEHWKHKVRWFHVERGCVTHTV